MSPSTFERTFHGADLGMCIVEMIRDASGQAVDYRFTQTNAAFAALMGITAASGRTVLEVTPDVNRKWIAMFDQVARTGEYLHIENFAPSGRWFDIHAYRVGEASTPLVAIIFSEITLRKNAQKALRESESALRESERRLNLAIDAGRLAVWEVDLATSSLTPSPALNRLYGFAPDATPDIAAYQSRYAPGERDRLSLMGADLLSGKVALLETEVRLIIPGEGEKWLLLRAQMDQAPTGGSRIIGVAVDVTSSKQAEQQLTIVTRELEHRIKNILTMVTAIATQTFRGSPDRERVDAFTSRIGALAEAQSLVMGDSWRGTDIETTMRMALKPFGTDRIRLDGGHVPISPRMALSLALATNELATNAVKYGALGVAKGRVNVRWALADGSLKWAWEELDGPTTAIPTHKGFGSVLIEQVFAGDFSGEVRIKYKSGFVCELTAPDPSFQLALV